MIKYTMLRVINSSINLPCHLPVHEKWKLRKGERAEKLRGHKDIWAQFSGFHRLEISSTFTSHSLVGRFPFFPSLFVLLITSVRQQAERGSPKQRREGENGR